MATENLGPHLLAEPGHRMTSLSDCISSPRSAPGHSSANTSVALGTSTNWGDASISHSHTTFMPLSAREGVDLEQLRCLLQNILDTQQAELSRGLSTVLDVCTPLRCLGTRGAGLGAATAPNVARGPLVPAEEEAVGSRSFSNSWKPGATCKSPGSEVAQSKGQQSPTSWIALAKEVVGHLPIDIEHGASLFHTKGLYRAKDGRSETSSGMKTTALTSFETRGTSSEAMQLKRSEVLESYRRMTKNNSTGSFFGFVGFDVDDIRKVSRALKRKHSCLDCFRSIVFSPVFAGSLVCLIVGNAVFIAVQSQHDLSNAIAEFYRQGDASASRSSSSGDVFPTINLAFTIMFALELMLRMLALEGDFWFGADMRWNLFDVFLVMSSVVEMFLSAHFSKVSYFKCLRLMKMLRSVRLIRVLRFFRQLRLMLLSVLNSLMPLLWAIIFLVMVVFVFAVIAIQGVSDFLSTAETGDEDGDLMLVFFGSLPTVLLSHVMAVTGGISWHEISCLLARCSNAHLLVFVFYILVMLLMVLNIITGIFVTDAIQMAQNDRDFALQAKMDSDSSKCSELKRLFYELDTDLSGCLTKKEFERLTKLPRVSAAFGALGLEIFDPAGFFEILDIDGSKELEIDEFVVGCMHLAGDARAISVDILMSENKRMMKRWVQQQKQQQQQQQEVSRRLEFTLDLLTSCLTTNSARTTLASSPAPALPTNQHL